MSEVGSSVKVFYKNKAWAARNAGSKIYVDAKAIPLKPWKWK